MKHGPLRIDRRSAVVPCDCANVQVVGQAYRLLLALATAWTHTVSRSELPSQLWASAARFRFSAGAQRHKELVIVGIDGRAAARQVAQDLDRLIFDGKLPTSPACSEDSVDPMESVTPPCSGGGITKTDGLHLYGHKFFGVAMKKLAITAALGSSFAMTMASADPLRFVTSDLGVNLVRVTLVVHSLDDLKSWLELQEFGSSARVDSDNVIDGKFSFRYSGAFSAMPLVNGTISADRGVAGDLLMIPDAPNSSAGLSFSYLQPSLLSGGVALVSFVVTAPLAEAAGTIELFAIGLGGVLDNTLQFSAAAAGHSWARVSVASVVPEPASYLLMTLGVVGLFLRRKVGVVS